MPYSNPDKQREVMRDIMRKRRAAEKKQRISEALTEHLLSLSEAQHHLEKTRELKRKLESEKF